MLFPSPTGVGRGHALRGLCPYVPDGGMTPRVVPACKSPGMALSVYRKNVKEYAGSTGIPRKTGETKENA